MKAFETEYSEIFKGVNLERVKACPRCGHFYFYYKYLLNTPFVPFGYFETNDECPECEYRKEYDAPSKEKPDFFCRGSYNE